VSPVRIGYAVSKREWEKKWSSCKLTVTSAAADADLPEVTLWAAFDADHLYLVARVKGPWGLDGHRSWRYGDGLQVVLSPEGTEGETSRYLTLGFSQVAGEPVAVLINRNGRGFLTPAPEGTRLAVVPEDEGALYRVTVPWAAVAPVHGLLDPAMGLNVTYLAADREAGPDAPAAPSVLQLVPDQDYDSDTRDRRRVARVTFDIEGLAKTTVKARPSRTFGSEEDHISAEIVVFTRRAARCEVVTETRAAARSTDAPLDTTAPAPPPAAPGRRPASRSVTSHALDPGLNRLKHSWRAPRAGPGTYRVSVQVSLRGRPVWESVLSYYNLDPADIDRLEERYRQAVGRAGRRLYASLPSVAARLQWLRDLRGTLDPGEDPEPLRRLFEEAAEMVSALEAGRDPLAGVTGYQRRAFRSRVDGSLQPYSVHIPPQAAALARQPRPPHTGLPLLVMLHESGVDDAAAARDPRLVRHLDKYGWLLCAPFGRGRSGWYVGDSGRDVVEAVEAAETTLPVDKKSVFLAGFSMGGFGALAVGLSGLRRFTGLVILSGFVTRPAEAGLRAESPDGAGPDPGADDRQPAHLFDRAEGVPVFVAHGTHDPAVPVARARELVRRLEEAGAKVTYREVEGAGHGGYDVWAEVFEWLEQVRQGVRG